MGAQASCLKTQGRAQDTLPEGQQERIQPDNPERSNPGLQPGAACPLGRDGALLSWHWWDSGKKRQKGEGT